MGRIDVILSDELELSFRMKMLRDGRGKKGDISKTMEELVQAYVDSDTAGKMAAVIRDPKTSAKEKSAAARNLVALGKAGQDELVALSVDSELTSEAHQVLLHYLHESLTGRPERFFG